MKLRLSNILTYPRVRVLARTPGSTRVRIDGLVCDTVCAARSRTALEALPSARSVRLDFATGIADIEGAALDEAACQRAIDLVVVAKPLRRALDALREQAASRPGTRTVRA